MPNVPNPTLILRAHAQGTSHKETPTPDHPSCATSPLALTRAFLREHVDAVAAAAERLGGRAAFGRHLRLVGDIRHGRLTDRQLERAVTALYDLLTLQYVPDPDQDEDGFFAAIDPASEEVHDLCRLADAVGDLLGEVHRAVQRRADAGRRTIVVAAGPRRQGEVREIVPAQRPVSAARTWLPQEIEETLGSRSEARPDAA